MSDSHSPQNPVSNVTGRLPERGATGVASDTSATCSASGLSEAHNTGNRLTTKRPYDRQVTSMSSHPGVAVAGDPPVTLAEVAGMTQAQNPL